MFFPGPLTLWLKVSLSARNQANARFPNLVAELGDVPALFLPRCARAAITPLPHPCLRRRGGPLWRALRWRHCLRELRRVFTGGRLLVPPHRLSHSGPVLGHLLRLLPWLQLLLQQGAAAICCASPIGTANKHHTSTRPRCIRG